MRLLKISPKVKYFFLGILFVFVAMVVGIRIWNPAGRLERDREWFNQRESGATNIVNSHTAKLNEVGIETDKQFNEMVNEANKSNPDKKKLGEYATSVRQNLTKAKTLTDEACVQFKSFILSDSKDAALRSKDIEEICSIFKEYSDGLDDEEDAVKALLDSSLLAYKVELDISNDKLAHAIKRLGEFELSPLPLP